MAKKSAPAKDPAVAAKAPKVLKPIERAQTITALRDATEGKVKKVDAWDFDWTLIQEEPPTSILHNRRNYNLPKVKAHIRLMADGYKRGDRFPPLRIQVIDGVPWLRDGHCRIRAMRLAVAEGAVILFHRVEQVDGDETKQLGMQLKANGGLETSALGRASIYAQYAAWGWTDQQIAAEYGGTAERVRQLRAAESFPLALKALVNEGYVKITLALEVYNLHGSRSVELFQQVLDNREKDLEALKQPDGSWSVQAEPSNSQPALALEPDAPAPANNAEVAQSGQDNAEDGTPPEEVAPIVPKPIRRSDLIKTGSIKSSLPKAVVENMRSSFTKLTDRLDQVKVEGDKLYLPVTADELDELRALKAELDAKNLAMPPAAPEQGKEPAPAEADEKQLNMLEAAEAAS